jgi:hypothetical protein
MSYIPDLKKLKWIDLSVSHKNIRTDIEKSIKLSCCERTSDAAPLMIKGAFGVGKTNALSYAFTYAWTELAVPAFFIDLNKIIELVDQKRKELNIPTLNCQMLINIINDEVDKLLSDIKNGDWDIINGFSNSNTDTEPINSFLDKVNKLEIDELEGNQIIPKELQPLTKDIILSSINSGNKALVIIDEFEDKYWKLKQRLDYAGGGPIRELFDYVVKSDSGFYLIIGNGPASGYELGEEENADTGGNTAQDRRLDVLNVPSPSPRMLAKSFLVSDSMGYINFIWWLSRSRPGLIQKARKQLGSVDQLLEKDYVNIINENDIFSQQVDSQGETVKFLNYKFFEENTTPLIKNTILKKILLNISPFHTNISDLKSDINTCKKIFIGSKKLTSREVILSNIENDLISNDLNHKVSLKHFQEIGRYKNAEWKTISFYLNTILESISDKDGNIAFGVLDNNNWQEAFANSFFKPLLQMVYDFIVQFEDSGTKSIQECCDYLLEIINIVDNTTKEARLDIAFPGLIYKDKDEEQKNFQAINIINQDEIFIQLSPYTIREAFEQPIGEPKLNYKNSMLDSVVESIPTTKVLIRHFDTSKKTEIIFVPDLPDHLLKAYTKNLSTYITNNFIDKYWQDGNLTMTVVYFRENEAIDLLKKEIELDENNVIEPICALKKLTFKKIDEFNLQFPRQMMVFIDSLCKIAIVGSEKKELINCKDDKDESFIALYKIKEAISDPTWSERKEVRRTIEHYSKVLFDGDKSAVSSIVSAVVKDYDKELDSELHQRNDMWSNLYRNKINDGLFQSVSGIEDYTKRVIALFLIENSKVPKGFLDVIKTAIDITKNDIEKDKNSSYLNFFHFKQFIQSSGTFLNEHESFSLETHFYKALSSFYSKLITKEDELESIQNVSDYLVYEKSCIDTYHAKLGGFSDSKIFSESLYNYEYFKTLNLAEIQQKTLELLNSQKLSLSNEITLLTESLGEYLTVFELKEQHLKYDEDARRTINKVIVPLIEIVETASSYSILITVNQLLFYIKRVQTNVTNFRKELDKVNTITEQNKEKLNAIQLKIDAYFDVPFYKILIEINGITKINCVSNFLKSVIKKNDYDDLLGDDKKYSQAGNYRFDTEKVNKLIVAINDSFNDQNVKAKKQYDDITIIVGEINEVNTLESKIEELLNTNING